jgi:putative heme-binding domain-containing protein
MVMRRIATTITFCTVITVFLHLLGSASTALAQQPQWIWHQEHAAGNVPQTTCHFRRTFSAAGVKTAKLTITADDSYEVFINGKRVGQSKTAAKLDQYDVSGRLARGRNVIAVKVVNSSGKHAGLAATLHLTHADGKASRVITDDTWRTNLRPFPLWNSAVYNDKRWAAAKSLGPLGKTAPFDKGGRQLEAVAGDGKTRRTTPRDDRPSPARSIPDRVSTVDGAAKQLDGGAEQPTIDSDELELDDGEERTVISLPEDFRIERLLDDEKAGSLIAMTFNEFGHIVASRENGPLILIYDTNDDGTLDGLRTYCDQVRSCQGILALNGEVFVTGDGPEGVALYRLSDTNRDGNLEKVRAIVKFSGGEGEHGAHGLQLGPDGMIYVIVGNHAQPMNVDENLSPHKQTYEGDLVARFEDPGGHAVGVKAPGGVVIRTDTEGSVVERVAGGVRNAYDLAIDRYGCMFIHDSDMESDLGTPWYTPTRLFTVVEGGEYGWRSGWAKWPEYYLDRLPITLGTGRGSPTGAVVYDHFQFPKRFHDAVFLADWSEGRILSVKMERQGAGYKAVSENFITGRPLNITDLDIGPNGSLYFTTGGRDTAGGLYKVTWKGDVPTAVSNLGSGITSVIRQPQLHSAWARQAIAEAKEDIGADWDRHLQGVARSQSNTIDYRIRALDIVQLFGPAPSSALLDELAGDSNSEIRGKAAFLIGLHAPEDSRDTLLELLGDESALVRRNACDALARSRANIPVKHLLDSLTSDDRYEAWAARNALMQLPLSQWRSLATETDDHGVFNQVALALLTRDPSAETAIELIGRVDEFFDETISDNDFIDMLRIVQLAVHRGELTGDNVPVFSDRIADEYPTTGNSKIDRELVRLVTAFDNPLAMDRMLGKLSANDVSDQDKIHLGLHMTFMTRGWKAGTRKELLEFLQRARDLDGGGSYAFYIDNAATQFAKTLTEEDSLYVLDNASRWPSAALGALYSLPEDIAPEIRDSLIRLDREIDRKVDEPYRSLKVGVVAILARSKQDKAMEYLREVWERNPERRQTVAMGLAQKPDGENWTLLVRSLAFVEGDSAAEVVQQLINVPKAPAEPEYIRSALIIADKLGKGGARDVFDLVEYWTGERPEGEFASLEEELNAWQLWFHERHPELPQAKAPMQSPTNKWVLSELIRDITKKEQLERVSLTSGAAVFRKSQCANCHRLGSEGVPVGPDLTNMHKRFMRKEVMEAILYPSHTISSQYSSSIVVTDEGKTYTGLLTESGDNYVITTNKSEKITIPKDEVEQLGASPVSVMPNGLIDELTVDEIADLFAYMGMLGNKPNVARAPAVRKAR